MDFVLELLKSLNGITELKIADKVTGSTDAILTNSIRVPEGKPSISDFAGLWTDNPKSIEQIRNQSWKRI
ncbi:MAG: hypothetical protein GXO89_05420 [Chlorobi bacterium]|nr:hypothetical protein [Chlorobiota bacterium]